MKNTSEGKGKRKVWVKVKREIKNYIWKAEKKMEMRIHMEQKYQKGQD